MIGVLASAAINCSTYFDQAYGSWHASELARTERGIRFRLLEHYDSRRIADLYFDGSTWRQVIPSDLYDARQREFERERVRKERCSEAIPYEHPDRQTAIALRPHLRVGNSIEEEPSACGERDGVLWFGLGFYEGEGSDGVGGVGRYVPATKQIEIRRPEWLHDKSIDRIAFDGRDLWLAVSQHYEKDEQPWGLVRYDWEQDHLQPLTGTDDAPCGFKVIDLLLENDRLWVATDLGLSRLDLPTHTWRHLFPTGDGHLQPMKCRRVYERIIREPLPNEGCDDDSAVDLVTRFAPEVAREFLLREKRIEFVDGRAAGTVARDVKELRGMIERAEPGAVQQAMRAFAERKIQDRDWRDFALAYAKRTGELYVLSYFRDDEKVFQYLATIATATDRSIKAERALKMLPWIGGSRAIPFVLKFMTDVAGRNETFDEDTLATAIEAIERAAHLRIEADGRSTPLARNSDTPEYSNEESGAFRRHAPRAELARIVARWNEKFGR